MFFERLVLEIYLSECCLRGIYKSPTALFRIKKSETATKAKALNCPTPFKGKPKKALCIKFMDRIRLIARSSKKTLKDFTRRRNTNSAWGKLLTLQ